MVVVPEHKIFSFFKIPGQYNQDETEDDLRFKFETNGKEGNIVLNSSVYVNIHKFEGESSWFQDKGSVAVPNRMNFRKNSKRSSTPRPHFRKIILQFFPEKP